MRVLVTRPRPDADATAAELAARGYTPIVAPLLDISMPGDAVVDLDGAQAVLITSANGARALARVTDRRDILVFAVGDASAVAARAGGFARTESASGDVETLTALVAERLVPTDGRLMHLAGTVTAGDLSGLLTAAGGQWQGEQVLSNDWIERATAVHVNREKPTQYGYYWWSHEVEHGGRTYRIRSCRGAGGQFIFVLPELQLVAVFTSYYADNKPIQHFERVILPAFAQD